MDTWYYVCMEDYFEHKTFSEPFESFQQADLFRSTLKGTVYKDIFVVQRISASKEK